MTRIKIIFIGSMIFSGCSSAPEDSQALYIQSLENHIAEIDKKFKENAAGDQVVEAQDIANELQLSQLTFLRNNEKASIITPEGIKADCSRGLNAWATQRGEISLDHIEISNPKELEPGRCQVDVKIKNANYTSPKEAGSIIYFGNITSGSQEKFLAFKTGLAFLPEHVGPAEENAIDEAESEASQDASLDPDSFEARVQQILEDVLAKYNLNTSSEEEESTSIQDLTSAIGRFPIGSVDAQQVLVSGPDASRRFLTILPASFDPTKNLYEREVDVDVVATPTASCSVQTIAGKDRANTLNEVIEVKQVSLESCPLEYALNPGETKIGVRLAVKQVKDYLGAPNQTQSSAYGLLPYNFKYSDRYFIDSISNRLKLPKGTAQFSLEIKVPYYESQNQLKNKIFVFTVSLYLTNEVASKYDSIWDEFLQQEENRNILNEYFND